MVVDGIGAEVIELCDGTRTAAAIATLIAERYDTDLRRVRADVDRYVTALHRARFLQGEPIDPPQLPGSGLEGLALHVTSRCPLDCRHCYASPAAAGRDDPPLDLLLSAIDQARALGARIFKVTGGDPLARPEALEALCGPTDGAEVTILTSGIAPVEQLGALLTERAWTLQISLDGADAQTHNWYRGPHAYERLKQNLDALAAEDLLRYVTLSVCLSKINRHQIEQIVQQALDWGVGSLHLARISRHGRAQEYWPQLSLQPDEWVETYLALAEIHHRYSRRIKLTGFLADYLLSCVARPDTRGCTPGRHVMMDLDGLIYPCIMMGRPETCLGDLRRQPLSEILASTRLADIRSACQARIEDPDVCGDCDWRMICRGACPGWPLVQDGTISRTDDLCSARRKLFPRLLFQLADSDGGGHSGTPCPE